MRATPSGSSPATDAASEPSRARSPMRLFTRLLISHIVPPLVPALAVGLALTALLRVGSALATLKERELATLRTEGELHRSTWALDLEIRHASIACARNAPADQIHAAIASKASALQRVRDAGARYPAPIGQVVDGYLEAARDVRSGPICDRLHAPELQARVGQLDEQLTNVWVERLAELHRAVQQKESDAAEIAVRAALLGIPLALLSFVLAMWIARQMARLIEEPLATLARAAQRVGRGDFSTPAVVDGPPEVLALAGDLDRMRRQLQQLETLKQGFLATVSHELRTPLSKIREGLSLLADGALGPLDDRKMRVVQIARAACEREIRMVTTLLDLSRLRAGSPIRLRRDVSIDAVLLGAIEGERAEAQARGVAIEQRVSGTPELLRLDPALMERAIANLVRNAIAVSARGQVVTVERLLEQRPSSGEAVVRIVVSDEGPGVPGEIREKLFDAFVTSPVPNSSKSFGSGIGLALAREVARAHGGDLTLRESLDRGAVFELWVPVESTRDDDHETPPRFLGLNTEA